MCVCICSYHSRNVISVTEWQQLFQYFWRSWLFHSHVSRYKGNTIPFSSYTFDPYCYHIFARKLWYERACHIRSNINASSRTFIFFITLKKFPSPWFTSDCASTGPSFLHQDYSRTNVFYYFTQVIASCLTPVKINLPAFKTIQLGFLCWDFFYD